MTTTPKLYRDMLPNFSQIYNDPYAKKQAGSQSTDISETINKGLDIAYNTAIDHAKDVIENFYHKMLLSKSTKEYIQTELEQLKKKH
jgi:hypothetical protein